ncbi:MAG: 2OG-Fe(II) oxygenase [Wenzhouxiangella sp.]
MHNNPPETDQLEHAANAGDELAGIDLASRLLEKPDDEAARQRALELLRKAADGPQAPAAQWVLGGFYLQSATMPGALEQAQYWLERAGKAGVGPALDRLANMHLRGVGAEYAPARALSLLRRLADAGFQHAAWEVGYLHSTLPELQDAGAAVTAFARACALGYPPAYYSLGLRFAVGAGVDADPAFARALLLRAGDANLPDALAAADELADEASTQAVQDWYQRLRQNRDRATLLLRKLATSSISIAEGNSIDAARLEAHFAALGHPALKIGTDRRLHVTPSGDRTLHASPGPWKWLGQRPRVAICRQFMSREERARILTMTGEELLVPGDYTTGHVHGGAERKNFDGSGRAFGALTSDALIRCIERRIAELSERPVEVVEPSSVIRYQPGQQYHLHVDYFSDSQLEENLATGRELGGQRLASFLVCLRAADEGGATRYPRIGLDVEHRDGQAVMHYNTLPDGSADDWSQHHGMPVIRGEKWLLRTTLRANSRYPSGDQAA